MFWSKKKEKESLPELPPLRPIFKQRIEKPMEEPETEVPAPLPEFPEKEVKEEHEFPMPKKMPKIREIDELSHPPIERRTAELKPAKKTEDIFVKIDKFHSARKSLALARTKIHEIEQLLGKIRDIKMREEQELESWGKEIDLIKTKIEDVTKNIFEKVD